MRGVDDEGIVTRVRHHNAHQRAVTADAVKLFHDVEKGIGRGAKVLEHMAHLDFLGAIVIEGPG